MENLKLLFQSISIITVSEIGDKTFIIIILLSIQHNPILIFSASFLALFLMSLLSSFLSNIFQFIIDINYIHLIATILFFIFSIQLFYEYYKFQDNEHQLEISKIKMEVKQNNELACNNNNDSQFCNSLSIFLNTFLLIFIAEWGDRSQFTTITLAAVGNFYWVTFGVVLGHFITTLLAIIGGNYLATKISVKKITFLSGLLFLIFSVVY
ncbi:UPF0016-domain-containing protein, partial [Neoconidiobolus thromboides FSU 785]